MGGKGSGGENNTKSCGKGKEKACRGPGVGGSGESFPLNIRAGGLASKSAWRQEERLPLVLLYLQRSCPAHRGVPGRQKRPLSLQTFSLGLHLPLRVAIPPSASSMPLQGQSPRPRANLSYQRCHNISARTLPPVPLRPPSKKAKPGQEGCASQARAERPSGAPARAPARAHLGRRGGLCPAGQDGRSRRRPGAPKPRRGGAGPGRGRLRGPGRQAGARHGSCPIQHFTIPSPVSFGRESPAQISDTALPRSAGTDISRPGLLTPSRARRRGRWGGEPGRPGGTTALCPGRGHLPLRPPRTLRERRRLSRDLARSHVPDLGADAAQTGPDRRGSGVFCGAAGLGAGTHTSTLPLPPPEP